METKKPYLVMFFVQLIYGGMALFSKSAIGGGMNPFIFVVYRQAIAAVFLAPFAFFLESLNSPSFHQINLKEGSSPSAQRSLMQDLLHCSMITLSSILYNVSLRYTSATFAAASTNLIPAITFIMAVLLKMERISAMRELDGPAKVLGSVVCVAGALLAAFYQGPPVWFMVGHHQAGHRELPHPATSGKSKVEWVKGCLIMLAANTAWSLWLILQGAIVREYPMKMRLAALQCTFSALQSFVLALCLERRPSAWRLGWGARLLSVLYCVWFSTRFPCHLVSCMLYVSREPTPWKILGVIVTGITYWLQVWCIAKKGPVFTAAFSPLALLTAAAFSALLWNEVPFWGRFVMPPPIGYYYYYYMT
ncbi:hypothetical protein Taro_022386 [Colocasia esculenta]|uniref:WAT1-related protein n=1 Tax=Colocasia esculenta TaxID=4460 RepID=A0A843V881_COLES|nr:hypothetical protein [Colocasia esculenta]